MRERNTDILIIGSGMGGMAAATLLAERGFRVLVVEKIPRIGGRCSSMNFHGYTCTTGVIGIETGGIVEEFFKRVNADFEVRPAGPAHYMIDGRIHSVPVNGGLKYLFSASGADSSSIEKIMAAMTKALKWKEPSPGINLSDWLYQYTDSPGIHDVVQTYVRSVLMVNSNQISANVFFRYIKELDGIASFGYCTKGVASLPEALARVIQQHGGEIWTSARAVRILVENGLARGAMIRTEEREYRINASVVISDTGPLNTVELTGSEYFDADYMEELHSKLGPTAITCIQAALEEPLIEQNYLLVSGTRRVCIVHQPTTICPGLAPEGKHMLIAYAIPETVGLLSTEEGRKKEIDLCLDDLNDLFPDFATSAMTLLTGIYRDFWPGMHAWPGKDMPTKTPIINLYNVGDGVKQSSHPGLPAVINTGILAAEEIQSRMGLIKGSDWSIAAGH